MSPSLSPTIIPYLKDYSHNLSVPTLSWIGNNLEVKIRLMLRKQLSISFSWIGKNWEVQPEQHSKIPRSLCELGKIWKYSPRLTLKYPNFEFTDELRKVSLLKIIYIKCGRSCFKHNEWGIPLLQILRIYQWIRMALNKNVDYLMYYQSRQHVKWKCFNCKFAFKTMILWGTRR